MASGIQKSQFWNYQIFIHIGFGTSNIIRSTINYSYRLVETEEFTYIQSPPSGIVSWVIWYESYRMIHMIHMELHVFIKIYLARNLSDLLLKTKLSQKLKMELFWSLKSTMTPFTGNDFANYYFFERINSIAIIHSFHWKNLKKSCEWSTSNPWLFASLSYDGRLVINQVPKSIKYDILL